ncbi:DUF7344 domain-containing protein [Halovivax cerinus]|uniref:DUF7344 domain-containing protein n=1 Tax=Halovivax cerinus TaxID=1487865 RepID=A0ABD5NJ60_9EURY|nr:hypothetical protein [Halovivax cerinus]
MDWHRFETTLARQTMAGGESMSSEMFEAITTENARYAVYALAHRPDRTLSELADFVVGFGAMRSGTIATPADHENVRIRLHHVVMPKLDAAGYVAYDRDERTIDAAHRYGTVNETLGLNG